MIVKFDAEDLRGLVESVVREQKKSSGKLTVEGLRRIIREEAEAMMDKKPNPRTKKEIVRHSDVPGLSAAAQALKDEVDDTCDVAASIDVSNEAATILYDYRTGKEEQQEAFDELFAWAQKARSDLEATNNSRIYAERLCWAMEERDPE